MRLIMMVEVNSDCQFLRLIEKMLNIKGALVIMSLGVLVQHSKASIFDGIREAMSSVEDNLGKLLSDVITDVKETIDCSILAMEKAINFGGVFPVPPGNDKCKRDTEPSVIPTDVRDEPHLVEGITNATKQITGRIDESLSIVNKSLYNIIDEGDINIELKSAKNVLVAESDRLFKIDDLLKDALESPRLNTNKSTANDNKRESSTEKSQKDLKSLQVKARDKARPNGRDKNSRVLDEVLDVLDIETVVVSKDEDMLKLLVKGSETTTKFPSATEVTILAHEATTNKGNQSNINTKTNNDNEKDHKNSTIQTTVTNPPLKTYKEVTSITTYPPPKTFKEVATTNPSPKTTKEVATTNPPPKTFKEVATSIMFKQSTVMNSRNTLTFSTSERVTQRMPTTAPIITTYKDSDYNPFFDMEPQNSESRQQAIEEANNLIESSKYSETIMSKYLENAKDDAVDIFGAPDLSNMFN